MNKSALLLDPAIGRRLAKSEWQREHRHKFKATHGYSTTANYGAGGNREAVLQRDGHACVKCGMTDREHVETWNRPITIDHIDRDRSNNAMTNLQTLCLSCHGRKDQIPSLRERKTEPHLPLIREMRAKGKTYQQIADATDLSIGGVWKAINGDRK